MYNQQLLIQIEAELKYIFQRHNSSQTFVSLLTKCILCRSLVLFTCVTLHLQLVAMLLVMEALEFCNRHFFFILQNPVLQSIKTVVIIVDDSLIVVQLFQHTRESLSNP